MGKKIYSERTVALDILFGAIGLIVILSNLFFPLKTTEFISGIPLLDAGAYATNVMFFSCLAVMFVLGLIFILFMLAILGATSKRIQKFNRKFFPMLISENNNLENTITYSKTGPLLSS